MDGTRQKDCAECKKTGSRFRHLITGKSGERTAERYLSANGYRIWSRNARMGRDEIDLIAYDKNENVLVFVEVKTLSSSNADYHPEFNFSWNKQEKFERAAEAWVSERNFRGNFRLDLICVVCGKVIDHFRDITF